MKKIAKFFIVFVSLFSLFIISGNIVNASFDSKYYTEKAPESYYSDVNTSLSGADFRRTLSAVISKGYVKHSYSYNNTVLAQTDPDPNKSGYIICLYTGQSLASGSWNKEHVWAKSHGFPSESSEPYSDAHHLRPTLNSINSTRGNLDFGEVTSGGKSDSYGNKWNSSVFEPRDEVKGDVARMMFYMATRYGFDGTFNLTLVDSTTTSASSGNGKFGNLQTLLKWHYQDPVSKEEIYRNNVIYDNYQKNRNPYIDHPEYVDMAYPNNYQPQDVDKKKVDNVIDLINNLPSVITLEDKADVLACSSSYNALSADEKNLVTNYNTLKSALDIIQELENSSAEVDYNTTIDFANHGVSNFDYTTNKTLVVNDFSFTASAAGCYSGELRIGTNTDINLDSKFNLIGNGISLESNFEVNNFNYIKINLSKSYGTVSKWYIFFKETKTSNYVSLASGTGTDNIEVSLGGVKNGYFAFVVVGSKPRLVINSIEIGSEMVEFINEQTKATLKLTYDKQTNTALDVDLRFGTRMSASSYNQNAKYGVIVLDPDSNIELKSGYYKDGLASSIAGIDYVLECNPVRVNENGEEDENGSYYQFAWVITNMEGHYDKDLVAAVYMELDGKLYFGSVVTASVKTVAKDYVDSGKITDQSLIEVLKSLYE